MRALVCLMVLMGIGMPLQRLRADFIIATTNTNFLVKWHAKSPETLLSGVKITGLQVNEEILGIDTRPHTGQLFAVGSSNRLYVIDRKTGVATQVGAPFSQPLNGSLFGYDFNPTIDRSRIVSDTRRNYVVNPNTAGIVLTTNVFYEVGDPNFGKSPNIVHLAYDNNFVGTPFSQLYSIDSGLDILAKQANSFGNLTTVGSLGIDINGAGGFDISGVTGRAYGAFIVDGMTRSTFYRVNINTGLATFVGQIGPGTVITAMAVQAVPEPSAWVALSAFGMTLLAARRKRQMFVPADGKGIF